MRDFYRFQVCWHPHTSSGEALRLACSLAAIGQTTVQVVAPIYPSDAPTGRQRFLRSLSHKLGNAMPEPGDTAAAVRALGSAGLGSNHFATPPAFSLKAADLFHAVVAGVTDPRALPTAMVMLGPEAHDPHTGIGPDGFAVQVVRELQLPVAIAPQGYPGSPSGIRRVTCTFDGSDASREALRMATVLAQVLDAEVRVATTTPPPLTEEETITRREPLVDPLLEEGCALVTEWSGADIIATPEPDWAMQNEESSAEARWLPEELVVLGHVPSAANNAAWARVCTAFGVPVVLAPAVVG